jgi:hypothetical protein
MPFHGLLISCSHCGRPVESVVYSERAYDDGFRGYWPFADTHEREYGCYPDKADTSLTRGRMPQRGEH